MLALVIDDDTVIRVLAARILQRAGLATIAFATADAAMALLDPPHPDVSLVVTDVTMPGSSVDGLELARRLLGHTPGPRVVVMSGSEESLREAASLPGIHATVPKGDLVARLTSIAAGLRATSAVA